MGYTLKWVMFDMDPSLNPAAGDYLGGETFTRKFVAFEQAKNAFEALYNNPLCMEADVEPDSHQHAGNCRNLVFSRSRRPA
ncbi:MAG: hypothetical protein E6Q97_15170 [Desulfurellales bacterium]|nr:MAG: hypothetical protein E6Q97_15170 [Desulfurellales bacterium]